MDQCTTQCQLLFHTSGKFPGRTFLERFNLYPDIVDKVLIFFDGSSKDGGKKFKVFINSKILIKRKPARHISNCFTDIPVFFYHVHSSHFYGSFGCQGQGYQNVKQSRFPGTISSNEAKQLI